MSEGEAGIVHREPRHGNRLEARSVQEPQPSLPQNPPSPEANKLYDGGLNHDPSSTRPQLCRFFSRNGHCRYGNQCRYTHDLIHSAADKAGGAQVSHTEKNELCRFYERTGRCRFGRSCRYVHRSSSKISAKAAETAVTVPSGSADEVADSNNATPTAKAGLPCQADTPSGQSGGDRSSTPAPADLHQEPQSEEDVLKELR